MPKPKRLTYRELKKRLKKHDIFEMSPSRGRGSERIFFQESTNKFHSVTCHGEGKELGIGLLKSIVRRFNLPKDFLD
ncbi:type II toxin-antitoxin system HicA family toxin [candidate division KSB1 bacterium]|nr:type II toxin-antitoxin system HicA family toxin [candidate division KSB1 bacterium]